MKNWKVFEDAHYQYRKIEFKEIRNSHVVDYPFAVLRDLPRF
jgi:hypothetical protein